MYSRIDCSILCVCIYNQRKIERSSSVVKRMKNEGKNDARLF